MNEKEIVERDKLLEKYSLSFLIGFLLLRGSTYGLLIASLYALLHMKNTQLGWKFLFLGWVCIIAGHFMRPRVSKESTNGTPRKD